MSQDISAQVDSSNYSLDTMDTEVDNKSEQKQYTNFYEKRVTEYEQVREGERGRARGRGGGRGGGEGGGEGGKGDRREGGISVLEFVLFFFLVNSFFFVVS
jgi:hypothetical protein